MRFSGFRVSLFIFLIGLLFFQVSGCSKGNKAAQLPVKKVAIDAVDASYLEQETHNLPFWLEKGGKGRTLVLFSSLDGLVPVSNEIINRIEELSRNRNYGAIAAVAGPAPGFVYKADNLVYVAHKLDIVDEFYWVVPTFTSLTQQDLDGFSKYVRENHPEIADDFSKIKLKDNVASGKVAGMHVTILSLQDIPKIENPVLLAMDVSYFQSLYQDEKTTPVLTLPSALVNTLKEKGITSDMVTISPSTGRVPARFRFLAGYLKELLQDPAMTDKAPPKLWADRAAAWKVGQKSPREAVPMLKSIIAANPNDAASHYDLSESYFRAGDLDACKKELDQAMGLDSGYGFAYPEYATLLAESGKKDKAAIFAAVPTQPAK